MLKNVLMRKWLLLTLFFILLSLACTKKINKEKITYGRIEYNITYLNSDEFQFDKSLLPKKMILEFNEEYSINIIDGFMGMFRLGNITYFKNKKCTTYLKALNKNYIYYGNKFELMCCFNEMAEMEINYNNGEVKELAGFQCKKATVTFKNSDETFDIYYTEDIHLRNPNSTNPYKGIDGILMEFNLYLGKYKMKFTASDFENTEITEKNFRVPNNARPINRKEMTWALMRIIG